MEIICDTNIWYNLGNGTLKNDQLTKTSLVATFYNFEELITSPNISTDFQKVRSAAKAIVNHSSKQMLENAFLYMARIIDPLFEDKRYSYNLGVRNWGEIRSIAALDDSFQLTPEFIKEYQKNIQNRIGQGETVATIENQFAQSVKSHSKKLWKERPEKYYKERFRGILLELNDYLKMFSDDKINLQNKNIKNFELFLTAFLQLSRNAEIAKWKIQPNDTYDLYNLIYVKPGDKYFTMEKRWINLITEVGLSHYLFII
jgi:hypothetical protein